MIMKDFGEFREVLDFTNKYKDGEHIITLYATSDSSCLISIEDKSDYLVKGAILYHNGNNWVVINNDKSYMAVSRYMDYLEYCNDSIFDDEQEEFEGIDDL